MTADQITLVLYSEDPDVFGSAYQAELQNFRTSLQNEGVAVSAPETKMDAPAAGAGWVSEFVIPAAQIVAVPVAGIVGAWLRGRFRRKVRIEFYSDGKVKRIEAQTPNQVISLIETVCRGAQPSPMKKPAKKETE